MIVSILANGAPFKWSSGLEADLCFKSKTFKLYRKVVKRDLQLHLNMPLRIKGVYWKSIESRKASKALLMGKVPPLTETPYDVLGFGMDINLFIRAPSATRLSMFGPHVE